MKFTTHQYADISTAYLEQSDLDLLGDVSLTGHIAEEDEGRGSFWYASSDDEVFSSQVLEWRNAGLSERFIAVMTELREQGIPYVRFDADGGEIEGLEPVTTKPETFDVLTVVRIRVKADDAGKAMDHVGRMIDTHLNEMLDSPAVVEAERRNSVDPGEPTTVVRRVLP